MSKKRNVVLYLDQEIIEKSRALGFNLSKTFENYLKQLITEFQNVNTTNNCGNHVIGSPGGFEYQFKLSGLHFPSDLMY